MPEDLVKRTLFENFKKSTTRSEHSPRKAPSKVWRVRLDGSTAPQSPAADEKGGVAGRKGSDEGGVDGPENASQSSKLVGESAFGCAMYMPLSSMVWCINQNKIIEFLERRKAVRINCMNEREKKVCVVDTERECARDYGARHHQASVPCERQRNDARECTRYILCGVARGTARTTRVKLVVVSL